jgi:hypothetical protein
MNPLASLLRLADPAIGASPGSPAAQLVLDPAAVATDPDKSFAVLDARWAELRAWLARGVPEAERGTPLDPTVPGASGASGPAPELVGPLREWERFAGAWRSRWRFLTGGSLAEYAAPDVDGLRAQAQSLAAAESNAGDHGYRVPTLGLLPDGKTTYRVDAAALTGAASPPPTGAHDAARARAGSPRPAVVRAPPTPSWEQAHPTLAAADRAVGPAPPGPPPAVPLAVRAAALFTLAAASVAGAAAMKSDGHRALAAGAGVLVTGAAALAMFWPGSPAEEKKS